MKRRTLFSIVATMAIAIMATFIATSGNAVAQQDRNCCNYVIDVAGFAPSCFPMTIVTNWGPGTIRTYTVTGNGVFVDNIPNCPPLPALLFSGVLSVNPAPACPRFPSWVVNNSCCIQIIIR